MFFDLDMPEYEECEVTCTPFRATATENEPFNFSRCVSYDTNVSVKITHVTYIPPQTQSELEKYYASDIETIKTQVRDSELISVAAKVKTTTINNAQETFVLVSFPLYANRIFELIDHQMKNIDKNATESNECTKSNIVVLETERIENENVPVKELQCQQATLWNVQQTDIANNLNVRLDIDEFTELQMNGPGSVIFYGEQLTAHIPEWLNHETVSTNKSKNSNEKITAKKDKHWEKLQSVNVDEDEDDDDDDDLSPYEMQELLRLARREVESKNSNKE